MKKGTKILLAGAGIVSVGLIAYVLLRKPKETATAADKKGEASHRIQAAGTPASTSTQEFVEFRKMRTAEKRAQRTEAQEQVSADPENITDKKEQEKLEAAKDTRPFFSDSQTTEEVSAVEGSTESK